MLVHMNRIFFIRVQEIQCLYLANVVLLHKGMHLGSVFHYRVLVMISSSFFVEKALTEKAFELCAEMEKAAAEVSSLHAEIGLYSFIISRSCQWRKIVQVLVH